MPIVGVWVFTFVLSQGAFNFSFNGVKILWIIHSVIPTSLACTNTPETLKKKQLLPHSWNFPKSLNLASSQLLFMDDDDACSILLMMH